MAISTIAALIGGLALSAAGTAVQYSAAKDASEASQRAEDARQRQLELESSRRRREIIRQSIIARSQAVSTATNQGAGDSSVLGGALGGITSNAAYGVAGVNQAESIGRDIFSANRQLASAQSFGAIGNGLSSLGGSLTKNLGPIGRLTYGI